MTETRGRPITDHSRSAQTRRESYVALRGAGLCAWSASCGHPAAFGSPYCDGHRQATNAACADIYAERKAGNRCRNCGTEVTGRSRCWLCSQKRKGYASRQTEYEGKKAMTSMFDDLTRDRGDEDDGNRQFWRRRSMYRSEEERRADAAAERVLPEGAA